LRRRVSGQRDDDVLRQCAHGVHNGTVRRKSPISGQIATNPIANVAVVAGDDEQSDADPHNLPAATGSGSGANPAYSPSTPAATIEEPATDRVSHSMSPKTTSITRANHEMIARMAPIEVATPLPPRPRRNGDNTCPGRWPDPPRMP